MITIYEKVQSTLEINTVVVTSYRNHNHP